MFQPLVVKHTQSLSSLIYTANMSHTHVNNPASSTPLLQPSLPLFSLSQPSLSPPLPLCQRLLLLLPCGGGHDLRIRNPTCFKMIMNITKVVLTAPRKKKKRVGVTYVSFVEKCVWRKWVWGIIRKQ